MPFTTRMGKRIIKQHKSSEILGILEILRGGCCVVKHGRQAKSPVIRTQDLEVSLDLVSIQPIQTALTTQITTLSGLGQKEATKNSQYSTKRGNTGWYRSWQSRFLRLRRFDSKDVERSLAAFVFSQPFFLSTINFHSPEFGFSKPLPPVEAVLTHSLQPVEFKKPSQLYVENEESKTTVAAEKNTPCLTNTRSNSNPTSLAERQAFLDGLLHSIIQERCVLSCEKADFQPWHQLSTWSGILGVVSLIDCKGLPPHSYTTLYNSIITSPCLHGAPRIPYMIYMDMDRQTRGTWHQPSLKLSNSNNLFNNIRYRLKKVVFL